MDSHLSGAAARATGAGAAAFDRAKMLAADPSASMLFFDTVCFGFLISRFDLV